MSLYQVDSFILGKKLFYQNRVLTLKGGITEMSFGLVTTTELNSALGTPPCVLNACARVEPTKSEDSESVLTSVSVRASASVVVQNKAG